MKDPFEPDIASLLQTFQLGAGAGNASSVRSHPHNLLPGESSSGTSYDETAMASALVEQTEDARAKWDRERNAPPIPVQLAPKRILLSQMEATRQESMTSSSDEVKILQTTIGHQANFSVSGLDSLSPGMSPVRHHITHPQHPHNCVFSFTKKDEGEICPQGAKEFKTSTALLMLF